MFDTLAPSLLGIYGPAEVVADNSTTGTLRVCLESGEEATATVAISDPLTPGDRVLVAGKDEDSLFVIGLIQSRQRPRLKTRGGAYAEVTRSANSEMLQVFSPTGDLLLEVDAETGAARLSAKDLQLASADQLVLAARQIDLRALQGVQLSAGIARQSSQLRLNADSTQLCSGKLRVSADQATAKVEQADYTGNKLRFTVETLRFTVDKLFTTANTLREQARDAYRQVRGLAILKAGRIRQVAAKAFRLQAQRVHQRAEEDVKLQGKRIDLG